MRQNETNYKEQCTHVWHVIGYATVKGKESKTFQCDYCKEQYISTSLESNPEFAKLFEEKKP